MIQRKGVQAVLILVSLFLSGFCGIAYEVLYARLLSDVIGSQFTVSASILVTFLLGIGIGTKYAHRLSGYLWAIEWTIGLCAVLFGMVLPWIDRAIFLSPFANNLPGQIVIVCALLIVPSTCVGATLPLFSDLLKRLLPSRVFSLAYMIYNFGAALTALAIEFYLIRHYGIRGTLGTIAAINFLLGTLLFFTRQVFQPTAHADHEKPKLRIAAVLALVSVASAIFQLLMLKVAQFVYGPFNETFAMILFTVLIGIALGAVVNRVFRVPFPGFLAANMIGLAALLVSFRPILFLYAKHQQDFVDWPLIGWRLLILFLLMGPSAICFGAAIPALMKTERDVARESGHLLFVSSLANAGGYLLMVFFVHQTFAYGETLVLIGALLALAWIVYFWPRWRVAAIAPLVVLSQVPLLVSAWDENLLYGSHTDFTSVMRLEKKLADPYATHRFRRHDDVLAIRTTGGERSFYLNGYYSISATYLGEHVVGILSVLTSPRLDDALVLGLGTGSTAGAVGEYFQHSDVIEISQIVIDHQDFFIENSYDIMHQPRVHLHCDDGIRFLKRSRKQYDLILNTVTNPQYFSSSKLYTGDFFRLVKKHLRPDGVYTTWIGTSVGNTGVGIILQTLRANFRHCWIGMIQTGYWLLICSDAPLALHQDDVVPLNQRVKRYYAEHGKNLEFSRYAIVCDDAYGLLPLTGPAPLNTLDRPTLEFEIARLSRLSKETAELVKSYIASHYQVERLNRTVFRNRPIDCYNLALYFSRIDNQAGFTATFLAAAERCLPGLGDHLAEEKLSALRRAVEEFPVPKTEWQLGKELVRQGHYGEAVQVLEKCLQTDPKINEAILYLGLAYQYQGKIDKARECFERELQLDPGDSVTRKFLEKLQRNGRS
jgi:spermidine synthase